MREEKILLGHGSGGILSHKLIENIFFPHFQNSILAQNNDAAVFTVEKKKLAFSTDTFVVDPVFFPGGDIGKLAVCGTINDLAVMGAKPLYLSAGFILEEGFPVGDLRRIAQSMQAVSLETGVQIVTGDTKVVQRGAVDKIFINTAGIGIIGESIFISGGNARDGDIVLINGTIGDHGMAVMAGREGLNVMTALQSDCAPLAGLIGEILPVSSEIHVLRDPTRGGLATTLNEIARQSNVSIEIKERDLPVAGSTQSVCEILGLDPLYSANEGKVVVICAAADANRILEKMRTHPYGRESRIIGSVSRENPGKVFVKTMIGGKRIIDMLAGEQLPRIC